MRLIVARRAVHHVNQIECLGLTDIEVDWMQENEKREAREKISRRTEFVRSYFFLSLSSLLFLLLLFHRRHLSRSFDATRSDTTYYVALVHSFHSRRKILPAFFMTRFSISLFFSSHFLFSVNNEWPRVGVRSKTNLNETDAKKQKVK